MSAIDEKLFAIVRSMRFVRLEQTGTPFDQVATYRITWRGLDDLEVYAEGDLVTAVEGAAHKLDRLDALVAAAPRPFASVAPRKTDPMAVTQPMARACGLCGHARHDGRACDAILTGSTARSGPDDVGEQCGCGS